MGAGVFLPPLPVSSRMLRRRLAAAGLPEILSSHSFRVLVVTDPHRFNGCTQMAVHVCLVRQSYRQKQSVGFSGDRASLWIFSAWSLRRRNRETSHAYHDLLRAHFPLVLGGLRGVPNVSLYNKSTTSRCRRNHISE